MSRLHLRLGPLMLSVAVLGLGLAAVRSGSPLWASACFTATLLVLLVAAVGTFARRGRPRLAWGGFAAIGWAYLLLSFGPWFDEHVAPHLLTTHLVDAGCDWAFPDVRAVTFTVMKTVPAISTRSATTVLRPAPMTRSAPARRVRSVAIGRRSREPYRRIGHSLAALLLALVGTAVVLATAPRDRRRNGQSEPGGAGSIGD